jgi:transcriptional regulator with XRE-family HTH domain
MYFSSNVRHLRIRKDRTQDVVANELGVTRSTLGSYENGSIVNPTLHALIMFSDYFKIAIDTLIRNDLTRLSEQQLNELEKGNDPYVRGTKLRILATTVDSKNKENIEVVPLKAKAGYKSGYADPDFIKGLPTFQLPILYNDRKYRMFQISGDSMLPIPDKSWVVGEYVENFHDIKDRLPYILLTNDEGIVFKMAYNQIRKKKNLLLKSLNTAYDPYEINIGEVREVWKFCNYISNQIPEALSKNEWRSSLTSIEQQLASLKKSIKV